MEYAPGTKINRAAELDRLGVNRKLLAKRAVESYLQQLLTYGFFHAGRASGEHASHPVICMRVCQASARQACYGRRSVKAQGSHTWWY